MSKLQPIITLLTFFLSFSALTNTNTQIDSLKSLFWKETDTHKKIDLADHLITTYRSGPIDSNFYSNTDSVIKYAWLAIRLSNHTKERPKLTKLFWRIGGCYAEKHDLDSAIVNYKKAISSIKPGADTIPQLRMNLGIAYKRKGEYHLALDSYQKSLDIAKSLKDGLSVGYLYDGIGSLYNELKQPDKALEYYALSVEALENSSHPFANSFKAQAFINSATVMIEKGNTDSARTNLLMAKDIFEGYKNERALAFTYATLGQVFYKEKDFENSIKYYKLTQNTARKLNDVSAIMSSSLYLAQSLHSTKRSQEALKIIDKALAIAKEKKLYSDIQKLSGVKLDVMKDLNIKNGIHETIALHLAAKDSVFNVENQKTFLEMQTKYETVQKEKELSDKNHALSLKENQLLKEKSRTQTVILTFGFLLILVTLTVFIFRARQRRKHYNQLKTLRQRLMRVQMNPHFFFNALNSIGGFISKSDSKKAKFYLSKFAKLMRVTLENSLDDLVTIEDEMKLVENYLHLEQMRENFEFEISIKEDLKDRLIPSLILQPIVENSIKHGFIDLDFKGRIEVYADKDALGNMIVKILDNGHGNDKSTNSQHTSVSSSLTQERLRLLCNDRAEYRMSFPKEGGTIVELKIPNLN